jgi:hypothetical protein
MIKQEWESTWACCPNTLGKRAGNPDMKSRWQVLAGFKEDPMPEVQDNSASEGANTVSEGANITNAASPEPKSIPITEFEAFDDEDHATDEP